jgi:hypothetical protein
VFLFFSIWLPAYAPPAAPATVATVLPRPLPIWWPMTPPTMPPRTAPPPLDSPFVSIVFTSITVPQSTQLGGLVCACTGSAAATRHAAAVAPSIRMVEVIFPP